MNLAFVASSVVLCATVLHAQETQAPAPQPDTATLVVRGRVDGHALAQATHTRKWVAGGVAAGIVTGLIGAVLFTSIAGSSADLPVDRRLRIAGESPIYRRAYAAEYGERLGSKRKRSALIGGAIGSAMWLGVIIAFAPH